jgi:O-antigen/teichoic acid export membrane protein
MTGTTIAQAIPVAISPILTRIYTPEDFGIMALYISIVSFIAIIVTARYEMAIVLPKTNEEAINILALALVIMFLIVLLTTFVIVLFHEKILELLNAQEIGNLLYLVPLSILLAGLNQTFNYWANRKKYFGSISSSQITQSIGIGITQTGFGLMSISGGLVFGNIFGRFVAAFVLIKQFIKNDTSYLSSIDKRRMLDEMKKHKDFPLINSLHAFSDVIRASGSIMLLASFFGSTVLGFYTLSLRVLQVPVGIIGSALGQVLFQKFTKIYNNKEPLYPFVQSILMKLVLVAIPLFGLLYLIAPALFAFVFGEQWRIAGNYSQILIPYLFMNFLISPISGLPIILDKQKIFFYFSLVANFGMLILLFIGYYFSKNIEITLEYTMLFLTLHSIIVLYWLFSILRVKK